jgi:hypothetical protein
MAKRLFLSCFLGFVICGLSFYVAYFAGLIYTAATGPLNPANTPHLEGVLRHVALPISLVLGAAAFLLSFRRFGRNEGTPSAIGHRPPAKNG